MKSIAATGAPGTGPIANGQYHESGVVQKRSETTAEPSSSRDSENGAGR